MRISPPSLCRSRGWGMRDSPQSRPSAPPRPRGGTHSHRQQNTGSRELWTPKVGWDCGIQIEGNRSNLKVNFEVVKVHDIWNSFSKICLLFLVHFSFVHVDGFWPPHWLTMFRLFKSNINVFLKLSRVVVGTIITN